jgi:hypothetical protein
MTKHDFIDLDDAQFIDLGLASEQTEGSNSENTEDDVPQTRD